jgi:D-3-phosphoglycerate dehydrogenase
LEHNPAKMHQPDELAKRIADEGATVLVCEADPVSGPVLDLPLVVVGSTRGDPTNVDVAAATAKGIPVLRAPGRNADAVAELTVGLLLAASRRICFADREVRAGQMYRDGVLPYQRFRAWQLAGRTAGLIGLGAIGRAVKWRLEGLGMRVIASDPFAAEAEWKLDDLLREADVVSVHAPVTEETRGLIGEREFGLMKPGVIYLNSARAAIHDPAALVAALTSGHLAAAGLDHFEHEWLDPADPLASLDNVVLTPHIGGATYDTETNHSMMIARDVTRILRGEQPEHCVNPEVLS